MTDKQNTVHEASQNEEPKDPVAEDYEKGQELLKSGDLALAANLFHNALLGFEERNEDNGVANASDKLGDICTERQDFTMAINHYDRAYEICHKESDDWSLISLNKKIAKARRGLKDYKAAIDIYLDLLDNYQRFKDPAKTIETLEIIADTYVEMGDRDKAADSLRVAAGIHKNFKHSRLTQNLLNRAEAVASEK